MRQINEHMKSVVDKHTKQPKPSSNPKNWNWAVIGTWAVMFFIVYKLFRGLYDLLF